MANIVLGVSGSIAAFKAAALAGLLVSDGHRVRVILTRGGQKFVTALTFRGLTAEPTYSDLWETAGVDGIAHIELAQWADLVVVAPASANALSRLALGTVDDLLAAVALSTGAPLVVAPAMETGMWEHPATQQHARTLADRGIKFVGPISGRLASGGMGAGRMSEPDAIHAAVRQTLHHDTTLAGRRVVVTAGPTVEPIDPVRYIGNHSSGKMGFAVADDAVARSADVTLITGPTRLDPPPGVRLVRVETAAQMRDAVVEAVPGASVVVMAAAVADFRPDAASPSKLKRTGPLVLRLQSTPDIAAEARRLSPGAMHIGFALETDDLVDSARDKLVRKGLDLIVANALNDDHNPLGSDYNKSTLVSHAGVEPLPLLTKRELARLILARAADFIAERESAPS